MLYEKSSTWSSGCGYARNRFDGSNRLAASVFTPEAISQKTFRRLTKENAVFAREIDKGKNCWNFAWLEENVSVPVSWERNPKEHSMCVGDCINSDRDRFTAKGVLYSVYRYGGYGTGTVSCGSFARRGPRAFCWSAIVQNIFFSLT